MLRVVGKIIGFHGLRGELKIYPLVDDLEVFADFKQLTIADIAYDIESFRFHKELVLVKLKQIKDLTAAEKTFNHKITELYVQAEIDEELAEDEYYIEDLKGMRFLDADSSVELGIIENCHEGVQKLLVVKLNDNGRELLVPLVSEYIIEINTVERMVKARISADLLELAT